MVTVELALVALRTHADATKAAEMARYHKAERVCLGVANPIVERLVRDWRESGDVDGWVDLADGLWRTDVHEARIAAAKLVDRRRIDPDEGVWALIAGWVGTFDAWAIADHAAIAGQKRVVAHPARIDQIEEWTTRTHMWSRRAALVFTLPFARSSGDGAVRDRVLGWAATYVTDPDWFIQKAVGWWLRELSKHDPDRTRVFLDVHGDRMRPFARREASKYL